MRERIDPFDDALDDLRISGTVLLHEAYVAPWAIELPNEAAMRKLLGVDDDVRVLLFHFVRRGRFELRLSGQETLVVEAGEVAICATGLAHTMSLGKHAHPMNIQAVLNGRAGQHAASTDAGATELVCGVFFAKEAPLNPMLSALPTVLKVSTADASFSPMLAGVAWMLTHEIERKALRGFTAARVVELFCAEAIRAFRQSSAIDRPGFLHGLADPKISEALWCIHNEPSARWSVESLAACVALSPSRFAARFREVMGRGVMGYVAAWRANLACRLLRESSLRIAEIAERVGYESLPAFSRAFKAQLGSPPAAWRAARASVSIHQT